MVPLLVSVPRLTVLLTPDGPPEMVPVLVTEKSQSAAVATGPVTLVETGDGQVACAVPGVAVKKTAAMGKTETPPSSAMRKAWVERPSAESVSIFPTSSTPFYLRKDDYSFLYVIS